MSFKLEELQSINLGRYSTKKLLRRPIADPDFLDEIERRGRHFKSDGSKLGLSIERHLTFDIGSTDPSSSVVASLLSQKNDGLHSYLEAASSRLSPEDHITAWLVTCKTFDYTLSRRYRAPVFLSRDRVVAIIHRGHRVGVYVIDANGIDTVYYTMNARKLAKRYRTFSPSLVADNRIYGLHSYVPVYGKSGWKAAQYRAAQILPQRDGGYIEIGHFTAISRDVLASARLMGNALNATPTGHGHSSNAGGRQRHDHDADTDAGNLVWCQGGCTSAMVAGVWTSAHFGTTCTLGTLGSGAALCWIGAGAWGLSSLAAGWLCVQACQKAFGPPKVSDNDPDGTDPDGTDPDGSGTAVASNDGNSGEDGYGNLGDAGGGHDGDVDGTGHPGEDGTLPIMMDSDPFDS